jgi:hypothetical protein
MKIKINLASKNHVMINNMYKKYCLHVEQMFLSSNAKYDEINLTPCKDLDLESYSTSNVIIFSDFCKTLSKKEKKQIKYFDYDRIVKPFYSEVKKLLIKEQNKKERELKKEQSSRYISTQVKRDVWRRDNGRCVECGSKERLEYDHIIPFSKGGSDTARNIQLLCEICNRKKSNNIE